MSDKRFTWIHSGQLNAPQMDGVKLSEGQMLKVLDAVLATGFNPQTATPRRPIMDSTRLT